MYPDDVTRLAKTVKLEDAQKRTTSQCYATTYDTTAILSYCYILLYYSSVKMIHRLLRSTLLALNVGVRSVTADQHRKDKRWG